MTTLIEAAKQALEACKKVPTMSVYATEKLHEVEAILAQAIAAAEQHKQAEQYDQQALELCERCGWKTLIPGDGCLNCMKAEQAQPVAWMDQDTGSVASVHEKAMGYVLESIFNIPLYTAQPQRQPLTDEQLQLVADRFQANINTGHSFYAIARAIEAAHGITGAKK